MSQGPPLEIHSKGYRIPGTQIHLDPLEPVNCAIISHAHGDHAVPGHENAYCSEGTAAILKKRFDYPARNLFPVPYGTEFVIEGITFSFHPAGHILGSSQILWKRMGVRTIFTGDYKTEADSSCEPFENIPCDILITEVTFGQRDKIHPPAAEVVSGLSRFKGTNLLIGAYTLGKAQRLTRLINDHLPDFRVMIHPNMSVYHQLYEQFGFPLGKWEHYKREIFKHEKNIVYLVPPPTLLNFRKGSHYLRGLATGWDAKHQYYDFALPVSDHADWPALIHTIRQCGAKDIYTIHGEGDVLRDAPELSDLNIQILQ